MFPWSLCFQQQEKRKSTPGVIYVGHLPPSLYETQIRAYFSQFGTVTRFRLSRSKKVRFLIWIRLFYFPKAYHPWQVLERVCMLLLITHYIPEKDWIRSRTWSRRRTKLVFLWMCILLFFFFKVIASSPQIKLAVLVSSFYPVTTKPGVHELKCEAGLYTLLVVWLWANSITCMLVFWFVKYEQNCTSLSGVLNQSLNEVMSIRFLEQCLIHKVL